MVIEMLGKGILIRPLSVYEGKKRVVFRINQPNAKELGERLVLTLVDMIPKAGYAFHKILYLGLILIPRRLWHPKSFSSDVPREPETAYQVFCYHLVGIISVITLMHFWTPILRFFSKDKWLLFTERVSERVVANKARNGGVKYTEFVKIVEEEWKLQK
jgi:hypothetical protein